MFTDELMRVAAHVPEPTAGRRFVVAIAGPPAAGKSTFAALLADRLTPRAAVLEMDAFHFDDAVLEARGHRDRKGAPHTFDVAAYSLMLDGLLERTDVELSVPRFDRSLELSRNCAEVITPDQDVIITEGNWLLLDSDPWAHLHRRFDLTIGLEPSMAEIEARLRRRWHAHGLPEAEIERKIAENDLPNAQRVVEDSRPADLVLDGAGR